MSLAISGTSGLHPMTFARVKSETDGVSTQDNKTQPEAYWTPERMHDAVPRNMEIEAPEPEADPKVPDDSEGQGDAEPGLAPGFAPGEMNQLEGYWTQGNMQDAIPPNMDIDIPEADADPEIPADETPVSATADGFNSEEYWTPGRMRDALPRDMEIDTPEPDADSKISASVNPGFTAAIETKSEEYWTPERMRDAVPREMEVEPTQDSHEQLRATGSDLIQKYQQLWAAEWQQSVKILA